MGSARRCARTTASDASYDRDHTLRRPHSSASLPTSCACVVDQNKSETSRKDGESSRASQQQVRKRHVALDVSQEPRKAVCIVSDDPFDAAVQPNDATDQLETGAPLRQAALDAIPRPHSIPPSFDFVSIFAPSLHLYDSYFQLFPHPLLLQAKRPRHSPA
ncbi:hypothetical protein L226DRAFT_567220 [Lentinus tigrinus ALCF2SS1-7]|uniref:Uncharacterized protein n=1 Tax=Lentinus tigrinus ALCF2SS1-6 TaxID=1328759 RepID=A0A5C2SNZ6_9APHY|nr:hypothetical protein L227DRAFT_607048 [Lentinus tigrinus ALCF2SS1-6]RPD79024.1 hypothetical protein L226DRAFT_567220 [Lentinus tigrinus ALCF2SS1-7]